MADIIVKGYVNRPENKTSKGGKPYSTFSLNERHKDEKAPKGFRNEYYNVTLFDEAGAPEEGSYVTVTGYLKPRTYEHNGAKRTALDVVAKSVEVAPPREGARTQQVKAAEPATDPWDLGG